MERVCEPAPQLAGIVPYDPAYLPARALLSANENGFGVPEEVRSAILQAVGEVALNRYPDPLAGPLRRSIAERFGLSEGNVLIGNGGDELLFDFALAWGGPGRTFLNFPPTFSVYEANCELLGTTVERIDRRADFSLDVPAVLERLGRGGVHSLAITSPNNPTGTVIARADLEAILEATDALVLLDEAYVEFAGESMADLIQEHRNLLVLRTFSKAYALAGVRIGYVLGHEGVIRELVKVRQPYSVDAVSQAIAGAVMEHAQAYAPVIGGIVERREALARELSRFEGVSPVPSEANFLFVRVEGVPAGRLWSELYERGVLVRDFSANPLTPGHIRVSVGTDEENGLLLEAFGAALEAARAAAGEPGEEI